MAKKPKKGAVVLDDIKEAKKEGFQVRSFFDDALDMIEKKTKISSRSMAMRGKRLSTGFLALDMYLGGGLVPGSWTTVAGGEQACKSTLTMSVLAQVVKTAFSGISNIFDFEGSSDANYISNMLHTAGVKADPKTIFGVPDGDGGWIVRPTVRYYSPDNGDAFFDFMSMSRLRLPDKIIDDKGDPYIIFENTKDNRKIVGDSYDKKWFSKRNQFKVKAADCEMQMLTIVDSYPAMLPDQVDDDEGSKAMALQARMFSDGIKRFRGGMRRKMMTILGINQLRQRPATMFGDPAYEPCGDALKFYCFAHDTKLITNHGLLTAPQIAELLEQGKEVQAESAFGMTPVLRSWKVEEERDQMRLDASGYSYVGSDQHRQLVLRERQVDGIKKVVDPHWLTLREIKDDATVTHAVLRMPERLPDVPYDPDFREMIDLSCYNAVLRELNPFDTVKVICSRLDLDFAKSEEALKGILTALGHHGIFAYLDKDNVVTVPGLGNAQLGACLDGNSDDARSCQISAMIYLTFARIYPELMSFCAKHDVMLHESDPLAESPITSALDTLLTDEEADPLYYPLFDLMHTQAAYIEELFSFCDAPAFLKFTLQDTQDKVELWDVTLPEQGTVITDRFVSHNSDVRIRLSSRAVPEGWTKMKDRPGSVAEPSVDIEGGSDIYRFINARTIKNKMGGIPNQSTWLRLWESDGNGEARGFDPVFDTWHYMKTIGLVKGPRKKMRFLEPCPMADSKPISWEQFRILILGSKADITELCKQLGTKPGDLRKWCFKYLNSEAGQQAVKDSIVKQVKVASDADED